MAAAYGKLMNQAKEQKRITNVLHARRFKDSSLQAMRPR
jgi:hypothetical protein